MYRMLSKLILQMQAHQSFTCWDFPSAVGVRTNLGFMATVPEVSVSCSTQFSFLPLSDYWSRRNADWNMYQNRFSDFASMTNEQSKSFVFFFIYALFPSSNHTLATRLGNFGFWVSAVSCLHPAYKIISRIGSLPPTSSARSFGQWQFLPQCLHPGMTTCA